MSCILIIDYGCGNLASIQNMLRKVGYYDSLVSSDPEEIKNADKLILPGVGHFDYGMNELNDLGVIPVLNHRVMECKVPVLGICLGAQLMLETSDEGTQKGLGWISGRSVKFGEKVLTTGLKVPHMGWNEIEWTKEHFLFRGLDENPRFYFVHSYHMRCDDEANVLAKSKYGHSFVSAVNHDNICGVQFHPEKSHRFGMTLLKNFAES